MRACVHVYMRGVMHACVCEEGCMHACVHVYVRGVMHACVRVYLRGACMHAHYNKS